MGMKERRSGREGGSERYDKVEEGGKDRREGREKMRWSNHISISKFAFRSNV